MITTVLLQAGAGNPYGQYILMGLIFVVFYFFMIRPQVKKQKDQKKFVSELKRGDKVITTAGIYGKVADIQETYFLIEIDNGVKVKFEKSAISLEASRALNAPPVVDKKKTEEAEKKA